MSMGLGEEGDAWYRYMSEKRMKAGESPGRYRFIGNSMIPAGEYVAAKYYDDAIEKIAKMTRVLAAVDALMDDLISEAERYDREQNASGTGLPPASAGP